MTAISKYIYGIIQESEKKEFGLKGLGDARIYTLNFQNLAAIVSDTEQRLIDPTRKNVRAHIAVQSELLENYTLLPLGFGIVAEGEDKVRKLLADNYQSLLGELTRLAGKVEAGLKVFWNQEVMIKQMQGENQGLSRIKSRISAASSPMESQRLLIEAGKIVESVVLEWKYKYAERIYAILKQFSFEARLNNPVGIRNILNASFLVEKPHVYEFQQEVYKLDATYKGKMDFKYIGPLPPYSFINLRLETAA